MCVQIPFSSSERSRFVFTNSDLVVESEDYCKILQVENANLGQADPWPNMLDSIGISVDNVGDIIIDNNDMVYLAVDPSVTKKIVRLLPKVLPGTGITISELENLSIIPEGNVQAMDIQRLDKRQQKQR